MHSYFRVQPNYSVEVVLWFCCVVIGVVKIYPLKQWRKENDKKKLEPPPPSV